MLKERNLFSTNRKLNFSDASPDGQRGSEDISVGSGMSGIPGSPAMSSCSEGEPAHSPIENYLSPSSRSRSPILGSSMQHNTTQSDVDSLRLLLQEVFCAFTFCASWFECISLSSVYSKILFSKMFMHLFTYTYTYTFTYTCGISFIFFVNSH